LDQRYFKDPEQKIFLGREQKEWFFSRMESNDLPKLIFGSQQFWSYKKIAESFEKEAKPEFIEVLDKIKAMKVVALFF
ncbi:MAG: hypothetical protein L6Q37_14825, partial [Bdellovibrionaceae bacterium]|nr:hypothetical protein [Pseudobdellovibrionaceae bacterium]